MEKNLFIKFLEKYEQERLQCATELQKDNRNDEASFEKIKASICPIFKAFIVQAKTTEDAINKILNITLKWEDGLNKAIEKNDYQSEMVERTKLETRDLFIRTLREE